MDGKPIRPQSRLWPRRSISSDAFALSAEIGTRQCYAPSAIVPRGARLKSSANEPGKSWIGPWRRASPMSKHSQEQIQMIIMVKGRAAPNAPPIINTNADSKFASACTSYPDMPLLHRAPAPWARWMCMVKKGLTGPRKKAAKKHRIVS